MTFFKLALTSCGLAALLAAPSILVCAAPAAAPESAPPAQKPSAGGTAEAGGSKSGPKAPAPSSESAPHGRVEWMEWGPDAFRKAILRERPILLNIVVSWSKACREAEAVWSDPAIARIVGSSFVAVRVDADRRPDIYERYRAPGWPAITLLLPNGVPFYASKEGSGEPVRIAFSNFPPERLKGVLEEAAGYLRDPAKRAALKRTIEEGQKAEQEPKFERGAIDPAATQKVFDSLRANFDSINGGWTNAPKFLMTAPIELSLLESSREKDSSGLEMGEQALRAVASGALFDRVEGGIHRIAAKADWSAPEYEKLLDRNVGFLDSLLDGYLMTAKQEYADRAADIIRYLESTLRRKGGGYFAGQTPDFASADGGGYYRASSSDRKRMKAPPVSGPVLIGWSAKAAAAELRAALLMQRPEWIAPAKESLAWVMRSGYERGRGVCHAIEGEEKILPAYLEDQALFAEAMLDAYQFTGDRAYLQAAKDTAGFTVDNLYDRKVGLFSDIIPNPNDPAKPMRTALHPYDVNCRMARLLAHLYYLNPQERALRDGAKSVLETYSATIDRGPIAAMYALAAAEYREGPVWGWVVGSSAMPGFEALLAAANRVPTIWKLIVTLDPAGPNDAETIVRLGINKRPPPVVYFRSGSHTSRPAPTAKEVPAAWRSLAELTAQEKSASAGTQPPAGQPATPGVDH